MCELRRKGYGSVTSIPASGKIFIIGDLHEQVDILLDIFEHIQSNQDTCLDLNPDNKIIFTGDIITPTKSFLSSDSVLGLDNADPQCFRGDSIVRAITMLLALYPNQVIPINGNHEIGFYLGTHLEKYPCTKYHPSLFQDILSSHYAGSASIENHTLYAQIIEHLPLAVFIQQQAHRHLIIHSPGSHTLPSEQELLQTRNILDWVNNSRYIDIIKGHGDITKVQEHAKQLGAQSMFFGHAAPDGLLMAMAEKRWLKKDNDNSALGFDKQNNCFVDSQTRTMHSGYVCLDFDNDRNYVIPMTSINTHHHCSALALQATRLPKPKSWSTKWQHIMKTLS